MRADKILSSEYINDEWIYCGCMMVICMWSFAFGLFVGLIYSVIL